MDANSSTQKNSTINEDYKFVTPLVNHIEIVGNCTLKLFFNDSSNKIIDFTSYLNSVTIFKPYLNTKKFNKVKLDYGDLVWPGNVLDFHASSLYNWK